MKTIISSYKNSAQELKNVRSLVLTAMLIGLAMILGAYAFMLTPTIKISFSFLANEVTALLFGPVMGGIMGGTADILKYMINPAGGAYFPGFTLNGIVGGMIFGIFLYRKPLKLSRIIGAKVTACIIVNMLMTTTWLHIMLGTPWLVLFSGRLLKQIIMVPIEILMFWTVATALTKVLARTNVMHA